MTKSYPKAGTSVNKQASAAAPSATPAAAPSFDRSASRNPATFTPYYWEAYNEIVEPRRFDHYLIRKWAASLGPTGFIILKVLRDRCYHNPATGILRNEVEVELPELAQACGISVSTLTREFANNEALGAFVQRVKQWNVVGGQGRRRVNAYRVSMDEPIHPDDMEQYDLLRASREIARATPPTSRTHRPSGPTELLMGQNDPQTNSVELLTGQNDPTDTKYLVSQNDSTLTGQIDPAIVNLPSGGLLTKENLTPLAGSPPIDPPRGNNADSTEPFNSQVCEWDPLQAVWGVALTHLSTLVNAPTLNAHLKPMRLVSVEEGAATLVAPSAFTRNWIEGRHKAEVEAALAEALGKPVTVQITTGGK